MINYTSWTIFLRYIKAIGLTTSEELHSESEAERTKRTNRKNYMSPYMRGIKNQNIKQNATLISNIYQINMVYRPAPELYVDVTYHVNSLTDCLGYT